MILRIAREGGKFRFTLGEMLVGIIFLAIPLAYWASNVQGSWYRPLSPSSQKTLASKPSTSPSIQNNDDSRNSNSVLAYKITTFAIMAFNALIFAVFLKIRRFGCGRW